MQYFNYFIMENNGTKIHGKHEFQYGMHLRYDQLTYMPQQQRTAGNMTFQAVTTGLYDHGKQQCQQPQGHAELPATWPAAAYLGYANYEVRVVQGQVLHAPERGLLLLPGQLARHQAA